MRKEILMAGVGWISAGVICIVVWLVELHIGMHAGLPYTGLVVIIIGAWLLMLNKRINRIIERYELLAKQRKANS